MSVAAVSTATGSSSSGSVSNNNMGNTNMFLQLLVAQMKNQDPLKPQDPTQMVTQLAQFNSLQQQITSNQYLKQMAASQGSNSSNAASYLGHTAVVNSGNFTFDGTTPQQILAKLSSAASYASVQVLDSQGNVVSTLNSGALPSGTSSFSWNGTKDTGGTAPSGNYSIQIKATDATGQPVTSTAQTMGSVSAVDLSSGGTQLVVNGSPVPLSNISQIRM
jgi:flagellar basal-body rod modification protein FlgD